MKCLWLSCLLMLWGSVQYVPVATLKLKGRLLRTDPLGNGYVVKGDYTLVKIDRNGQIQYTFSETMHGKLTHVDASNPLKLVLFYQQFMKIITLDNKLSRLSLINLFDLGLNDVSCAGYSRDNGIWVYDQLEFRLKKIHPSLKISAVSENLTTLLGLEIYPEYLLEYEDFIYLSDPAIGILVFDFYGTYVKTIPLKNVYDFQIINRQLLYFAQGKLKSYYLNTLKESEIPLPENVENIKAASLQRDRLFLLLENEVALFSL